MSPSSSSTARSSLCCYRPTLLLIRSFVFGSFQQRTRVVLNRSNQVSQDKFIFEKWHIRGIKSWTEFTQCVWLDPKWSRMRRSRESLRSVFLYHICQLNSSHMLLLSFSILGTPQARGWTLLTFESASEALASPNNNTNSGIIYVLDDFEGPDFQALHKSDRSVNRNERKNIFGPGIMKHHLDEIERMMEEKCPRSGNLQGVIVSTIGKFYNFKLRGRRICISGVRCKEDTPEWVRFHSLFSTWILLISINIFVDWIILSSTLTILITSSPSLASLVDNWLMSKLFIVESILIN